MQNSGMSKNSLHPVNLCLHASWYPFKLFLLANKPELRGSDSAQEQGYAGAEQRAFLLTPSSKCFPA